MSIKVKVYNQEAKIVEDLELSDKIFAVKANNDLVHQAMLAQMGNERQVLAHTKDRSEVRGGGRKPWRQKGTGRARAGSSRSPIWIGGGVTFGPRKDRNFSKNINKKMKRKAIFMVLSDRISSNSFLILDNLDLKEAKTKVFNTVLEKLEKEVLKRDFKKNKRSVLIINNPKNEKLRRSARNLEGVKIINSNNINILDLLKYQNLILSKEVVLEIQKNYE